MHDTDNLMFKYTVAYLQYFRKVKGLSLVIVGIAFFTVDGSKRAIRTVQRFLGYLVASSADPVDQILRLSPNPLGLPTEMGPVPSSGDSSLHVI